MRVADGEPIAGFQVEAFGERRVDRRAISAGLLGQRGVEVLLRIELGGAEQRIGGVSIPAHSPAA
jgi:hypothetical protein